MTEQLANRYHSSPEWWALTATHETWGVGAPRGDCNACRSVETTLPAEADHG
jgi:hypothetical protein